MSNIEEMFKKQLNKESFSKPIKNHNNNANDLKKIEFDEILSQIPSDDEYQKQLEQKIKEMPKVRLKTDDYLYSLAISRSACLNTCSSGHGLSPNAAIHHQDIDDEFLGKKNVVTDSKVLFVSFDTEEESHYLCGILNSRIIGDIIEAYTIDTQSIARRVDFVNTPHFGRQVGG